MEKFLSDSWISVFELLHKLDASTTVLICNTRKLKMFIDENEEDYYKQETNHGQTIFVHKESERVLYKGRINEMTNEDYSILNSKVVTSITNYIYMIRFENGVLGFKIFVDI